MLWVANAHGILISAIVLLSTRSHAFPTSVSRAEQTGGRMAWRRSYGNWRVAGTGSSVSLPVVDRAKSDLELDNEEPLSLMFQRAVVLQRAGSYSQALQEYTMFLKAAVQCQVNPPLYAEVYCNMGALYQRQQDYAKAREHLRQAISYRPKLGTAHLNLAVVSLQEASSLTDAVQARILMEDAQQHCTAALNCNADPRSVAMARRLLDDIQRMLM